MRKGAPHLQMAAISKRILFLGIFLCIFLTDLTSAGKKKKAKKESTPSYISIRTLQETHTLNATHTCHGGGWLPDPIHISCICIKGVWALSTGYCDENTTIYTGDGHCFQINKVRPSSLQTFDAM